MIQTRFFNFPLGYLGTEKPLVELPYPEDYWSFRVELIEQRYSDYALAHSHMQATYIYEVRQHPDKKAVGDVSNISDWDFYKGEGLAHSCKLFTDYLVSLIDQFGEVKYCSGEMTLAEYNWMKGKPATWKKIDAEQLRKGLFKNFDWGNYKRTIGVDLLFVRSPNIT